GAGDRFFEGAPFHVVAEMLRDRLGWYARGADEEGTQALKASLAAAGLDGDSLVPLFSETLGAEPPPAGAGLAAAPPEARARMLAALEDWVFGLAARRPLLIVIEDIQWVDPSTRELIDRIGRRLSTASVMLIATRRTRPDGRLAPAGASAEIHLEHLREGETLQMLAPPLARVGLGASSIEAVARRADGVPFFAEELLRLVVERGGLESAEDIPATIHDSLAARLDQLGAQREIAQIAAVIGREFSEALLAAVCPAPAAQVRAALERFVEEGLVVARQPAPAAAYQFRHALIQEAAYHSLLKANRRRIHAQVGRAMVEAFPEIAAAQPRTLARHWTQAGEADQAIASWKQAGDGAYARRAFREAVEDYRQALTVLATLAPSRARDERELELRSALVRVLQPTRGYSAPETTKEGARVRALAQSTGNTAELIRQEARTWRAVFVTGDYRGAAAIADGLLELSRDHRENLGQRVFAHNAQVQTRFYTGDFQGSEDCFQKLSPLLDLAGAKQTSGNSVISIGVTAIGLWLLGRADQARDRMDRAMDYANASEDPYDLAMALHFQGNLLKCLRNHGVAASVARRLRDLSEEQGFHYARHLACVVLGWAEANLGARGGAETVGAAIASIDEIGARVGITDMLTCLAEARMCEGDLAGALRAIDDSLTANPEERVSRPQTLNVRGGLHLKAGDAKAAERDFREAIDIARETGALAWELRAAMSLAEGLLSRGDRAEARTVFEPALDAISEGFDTSDLVAARAFAEQLRIAS
ncbi:MAG: hypothetical protein JOZ27_03440, partial [Caulobacteraceae bacterium]|nr:hypothetical protein [Caulobacteraceae bacterium]